MSDRFHPLSMEQLSQWVFTELRTRNTLFGIPRALFFRPNPSDPFRLLQYGDPLETPFGVAAGPHAQMAQNIVAAWLCGARFIELKTVQTLDELDVSKPCIDLEDEGYNVEWSQELKVHESFEEYARAWVLIHALHRELGFSGERPGIIFNMSVGYDLKGILQPNVQAYLDQMHDATETIERLREGVARYGPSVRDLEIPSRISNTVTLSTMHGCPPNEIEKIATYLLRERKLHTSVKCNPTLLGPEKVRTLLNRELGYKDVVVPDAAFEHDLKYEDAIRMLRNLQAVAKQEERIFGVKLSNTLEVENFRTVFSSKEKRMYLSGRPLHAITTQLALRLTESFPGDLHISYSAGADAFNVVDLLHSGMQTITVCSDLLKSGGYLRLLQYIDHLRDAMQTVHARDLPDFIVRASLHRTDLREAFAQRLAALLATLVPGTSGTEEACATLARQLFSAPPHYESLEVWGCVRRWADGHRWPEEQLNALAHAVARVCAHLQLQAYAPATRSNRLLHKDALLTSKSKTVRPLGLFDCIKAPCTDECPIDQQVPHYMAAVREGRFSDAVEITRQDNPLPTILGRVCDHLCEHTCIRTHYDEPLAIREMKRFIMEQETEPQFRLKAPARDARIAVIGGGPAGLTAAYELAQEGYAVTIFEAQPYAGGMVAGTIPAYRLPRYTLQQDLRIIEALGIHIRYEQTAGRDFTLSCLKQQGFRYTIIAVGAQQAKRLGCAGEECEGVLDALDFLRRVREEKPVDLGARIGVIGAGDTAMDAARCAWRLKPDADIAILYRRTIDQMPADREEVRALLEEGIQVHELVRPLRVHSSGGKLTALTCQRMRLGARGPDGRKIPEPVPDETVEFPLDTMILAISQHAVFDFFDDCEPECNRKGFLKVDPVTKETSVEGVFSGGDSAEDGPSSIVKACGDGKAMAAAIRRREAHSAPEKTSPWPVFDRVELLRRRARRAFREPIPHRPPTDRQDNFDEVVLTLTKEAAQAEASRCLDCHQLCSICVSVCPNLAIMTYETPCFEARLQELTVVGGHVEQSHGRTWRVDQPYQVAVLTDFCNECGNCATFCPTAGAPYRDKPRLYLHRPDFEAERDNAFWLEQQAGKRRIEGRFEGHTHALHVEKDRVYYAHPDFRAQLNARDFSLHDIQLHAACPDGAKLTLLPAVTLYALLNGLTQSMPHLPCNDG